MAGLGHLEEGGWLLNRQILEQTSCCGTVRTLTGGTSSVLPWACMAEEEEKGKGTGPSYPFFNAALLNTENEATGGCWRRVRKGSRREESAGLGFIHSKT